MAHVDRHDRVGIGRERGAYHMPVAGSDTFDIEFLVGSWLDERIGERGAHCADRVDAETRRVDVGVVREDVAFDLGEDQLAPHDFVRVERGKGQLSKRSRSDGG